MATAVALSAALPVAHSQGHSSERRRAVNEQLENVKVRLVSITSQYEELEGQRNENVKQAKALQEELAAVNVKQSRASEDLNRTRQDLKEAETAYDGRLDRFTKGLAHFFKLKNRPYLAFLIHAKDVSEFSRRYKYLQYVFQQDYGELEGLHKTRLALLAKQTAFETAVKELDAGRAAKEQKSQELTETIEKGQAILDSLNRERQKALERARQLQAALDYIGRVSQAPYRPERGETPPPELPVPTNMRVTARPGAILWPVDTGQEIQIVRAYGQSRSETGSLYFNPGIDIRVPHPQSVRAIATGRVMHRGEMPNFGKVVFIDHGGNPDKIISIYGNLDEILVPVGQDVARGQVVGTVGRADDNREAILHFEIRQNAQHLDPLKWLQGGHQIGRLR